MLIIPSKRIAVRRAGPCGTTGRLQRGLNRATLRRVDDTSDPGAGRTNLKRSSLYRTGASPTCGSCPSGTVLFDQTFAAEHNVKSGLYGNAWVELVTIAFDSFSLTPGCQLQITISLDAEELATPADNEIDAFMAPPGLTPTDFGSIPPALFLMFNDVGAGYVNYVLKDQTGAHPFVDFANPNTSESIYIWPGVIDPDFNGSNMNVKNIHVHISVV
jgi:hypothetical protein